MNRKKFLSALTGLGAILPVTGNDDRSAAGPPAVIPPYLPAGATIGITSPAGHITAEGIAPAIAQMISWGYKVKMGNAIGKKYFGFGGSDAERTADLQRMLDDPGISAIMCARGGYGMVRIIDKLDFSRFVRAPKWLIGFSDITVLHAHLSRNFGVATIHSKMCNSFPDVWERADAVQRATILSIRDSLNGTPLAYSFAPVSYNRPGSAEGTLVGGNLKTLESLSGTDSDLYTNGKILFLEDAGEYLYSIDRMFWNLKRTGKLLGLKALIVGGFRVKPDDPGEEFGIALEDIILGKVRDYQYPVCFGFPVGHQKENFALKCGVRHRLYVGNDQCRLEEIR